MITKFSEAHDRLLAQLEVHTHRRREDLPPSPPHKKANSRCPGRRRARAPSGSCRPLSEAGLALGAHSWGWSRKVRPVVIDGVQYPSITAARKTLRIGMSRVYGWLRAGKATYA